MSIVLNGTTGVTTPDVTSDSYTGALAVDASAPDDSVVVDASGNVGIGTSSPGTRLELGGDAVPILRMTSTSGPYAQVTANTAGTLQFMADEGNTGASTSMRFRVDGAEAARIDSSGNLLVGTTSSTPIQANRSVVMSIPGNGDIAVNHSTTNDSGDLFMRFGYNGSQIGSITQSGTTAVSYNTSSDYRLKEDWVSVADASTRVNALKPVNFAWKADGKRVDGFLAHELAEVVPEAVTGEKDAVELVDIKDEDDNVTGQEERPVYQGIDQSKLVPLLTAALQEALAKIDDLTARVVALEGQP